MYFLWGSDWIGLYAKRRREKEEVRRSLRHFLSKTKKKIQRVTNSLSAQSWLYVAVLYNVQDTRKIKKFRLISTICDFSFSKTERSTPRSMTMVGWQIKRQIATTIVIKLAMINMQRGKCYSHVLYSYRKGKIKNSQQSWITLFVVVVVVVVVINKFTKYYNNKLLQIWSKEYSINQDSSLKQISWNKIKMASTNMFIRQHKHA